VIGTVSFIGKCKEYMADKLGNLICPVAVSSSALKLFAEFIHLMGGCE